VLVDRLNGPPDAGLGLNLPGNAVRALARPGFGRGAESAGACRFDGGNTATPPIACCSLSTRPVSGMRMLARSARCAAMCWSFCARTCRCPRCVGAQQSAVAPGRSQSHDTEAECYDFVVCADGVHSGLRTSVFGPAGRRAALLSAAGWRFMTTNPAWTVGARGPALRERSF
jgi:2-polyprenyl-6-methoxyphenol hydroxylase-like FAD-dependent oxidoreductase